ERVVRFPVALLARAAAARPLDAREIGAELDGPARDDGERVFPIVRLREARERVERHVERDLRLATRGRPVLRGERAAPLCGAAFAERAEERARGALDAVGEARALRV